MNPIGAEFKGVSLPRSRPPAISHTFLSRSQLFPLLEAQTPSATLVIAPSGYGKTTLVSEWAQWSLRPTIWYTVDANDTFEDFKAHLVSSIQECLPEINIIHLIPDNLNKSNSLKAIVGAVGAYAGEVNFVIDFGRGADEGLLPFRQLLIDAVPDNVHIVIVRRATTDASLARYVSLGNLNLITSEDLKFSTAEIEAVASINNIDLHENGNAAEIELCGGWPAAVQLMCRNIGKNNAHSKISDAIASNANPLNLLALETVNSLNSEDRAKLIKLSLLEEFDIELASILLGDAFPESFINKLVTDGLFLSASTTTKRTYRFHPLVFEAISQIPQIDSEALKSTQILLTELFLQRGETSKALVHAFASGDQRLFFEIFREAVREMAAVGRGDLLIKWAQFAGDNSPRGVIRRKTIQVVGYLVDSNFPKAEAMAAELEFISLNSPETVFIKTLCAMVRSHVNFARGDFSRASLQIELTTVPQGDETSLQASDQIAVLRVGAGIAFLHDDFQELTRFYLAAQALSRLDTAAVTSYHLNAMRSMVLYSQGHYFQARELANISIAQAEEKGYRTISGALDAMMVLVRCQLEASELDLAIANSHKIMELAEAWEIWPWYFMAVGTVTGIQINQGLLSIASEAIAKAHEFLKNLPLPNQLSWLVDMSELFLKIKLKDMPRCEQLISRMPRVELVRQIETSMKWEKDPKIGAGLVSALPENTVREKINKWLAQASLNIGNGSVALEPLHKALDLGAESGYHEYFLRQTNLYPLIVRAAAERPTIYLEKLAQEMTTRINTHNQHESDSTRKLTVRELEIVQHLASGSRISTIAKSLHISQNTMKTHLRNTYRKLDADGRHTAVEKAKKLLLI